MTTAVLILAICIALVLLLAFANLVGRFLGLTTPPRGRKAAKPASPASRRPPGSGADRQTSSRNDDG